MGFPAGFNGIDPDLMDQMIRDLRYRRGDIATFIATYRTRLANLQVDTSSFPTLDRIGAWIDGQLPMLEERKRLAIALDESSEPGLVQVPDTYFLATGAARREGTILAGQFRQAARKYDDKNDPSDIAKLVSQLADHQNDPQYAAAFFAGLGPKLALRLPSLIKAAGGDTSYLTKSASKAFGSAVSAGQDVPGFSAVTRSMTGSLPPKDVDGVAALVSAGTFPPEWLAQVAQSHALWPVYQTVTGSTGPPLLDQARQAVPSEEAYKHLLQALGNNPEASRLAFRGIAEATRKQAGSGWWPSRADLSRTLSIFTQSTKDDSFSWALKKNSEVAQQLGRAYAAASGAYDERDGHHSKDAGQFAFTVTTTMPSARGGVPAAMRQAMGEIAGSYATEMTEGSNTDDTRKNQQTVFGDVKSATPGLNPIFGLSPKDTYAFLKTFADTDKNEQPFNRGMGDLSRRLIAEGVRIEQLQQAGKIARNKPGLDRIMSSLGYVSGLQRQAERVIRGRLDNADARNVQLAQKVAGLGLDFGSILMPEAGIPAELAWEAMMQINSQVTDGLARAGEGSRVKKLNERALWATLASQYSMVKLLVDAHYRMSVAPEELVKPENAKKYQVNYPGVAFTDSKGKLLPFDQIRKDPRLFDNYQAWLEANGRGGNDTSKLGDVAAHVSKLYDGARSEAEANAQDWERK